MINAIYGTKIGMTQIFTEDGVVIPVTVIQAAPNKICQIKTTESDGYEAVQLGFGSIKEKNVNKPMAGHFAKLGVEPVRHLREVRVDSASEHTVGEEVAGVMRRYNFGGGPGGHGAHFHRAPGSVGQCAYPSRVFKGVRLPGHMGCDTVTTKNLEVVRVDEDMNLIMLKGAVPGGKNGVVRIRMV